MQHFVIASSITGEILRCCGSTSDPPEFLQTWAGEGEVVVFTPNQITCQTDWRVVEGVVVERAAITPAISATTIAADGLDECVIGGLPDPCMVVLTGVRDIPPTSVTGGSIILTSTEPGSITVRVMADPTHKPWETTIHAA